MSPNTLYIFVDSDHATTDLDNRRSVTGYLIFYNGGLISWKTQLQKSNSSSSTESEYKAIHEAGKESLWISNILFELDLPLSKPIVIFEDNNSSINATENPVQHSRLKHIDIIYHQVRSWKEENRITLIHIPREKQIADSMNKASIKKDFLNFRSKIMTMSR
jgi:histone deacetylase 1/2